MGDRLIAHCPKCGRAWLLDSNKGDFVGSPKELKAWVKEHGRQWGCCYCGKELYDPKIKTRALHW